jgi:hypothetical protein
MSGRFGIQSIHEKLLAFAKGLLIHTVALDPQQVFDKQLDDSSSDVVLFLAYGCQFGRDCITSIANVKSPFQFLVQRTALD